MRLKSFIFFISLAIFASFETYAGTATQNDWFGGGGSWGPTPYWDDHFYTSIDVNWYDYPERLTLQSLILKKQIGWIDYPKSVYSADINGDGYMDVLGATAETDDIIWWENMDGSGNSWTKHTIDGNFDGAQSVYSADIDGDDDMDVLGAAYTDGITWWENDNGTGNSWTEHTVDGDFNGAMSVHSEDINGDGDMDVLGAAYTDGITWWENDNGTGNSWTEHTVDGDFDGAMSVHSADINGDGDMDVLGASYYTDDITWWENVDGTGASWIEHTVDGNYGGAMSVYSADINGDGDMDILGAAYNYDDISWWRNNNGSGTSWTKYTISNLFDGASSVYSADIDGDGDKDVLGAAAEADDITWWENMNGSGTIWTEHNVDGDFDGSNSACFADINGDGWPDILGSAYYGNEITWWDLNTYVSEGTLESTVLDAQESPDWDSISCICINYSVTSVAFQVRASDNSSSMGSWSDTLTVPCSLEGILANGDLYFQYRVILSTTDLHVTPEFREVTVSWQPLTGTQEGSAGEVASFALFGARPNPALGHATLVFTLPVDSRAELTVYDLTGRVVHSISDEYEPGVHEVILEGLAGGVYLIRMTSEGFSATQHFVVIE